MAAAERLAEADRRRPSSRQRGYSTEWERYRAGYLKQHPQCACGARATVVDHITPVSLGGAFWGPGNHQPLCARCHASKTMTEINARRIPAMPSRRTTNTRSPADQVDGIRDASDPKSRARLRKLMAALGVPENAVEVRFTLGDEPVVIWLMERP